MLLSYKRPSQRRGQRSRPLCALLVHTKRKAHTTIAKNPRPLQVLLAHPWPQSLVDTDNSALVVPSPPVIGLALDISGPGLSRSLSDAALASQVLVVLGVPAS